jgi:2-succinyl-5-enolpyruvyl-6-hydroxy-3-cyclohexene-1-carboxylate synthase
MNLGYVLVEALVEQGVDMFFTAPGSRVTPLIHAITNHPKAKSTVHFDERGVGFLALGYAKATRKPAVIVVTSGTAVGNLYPAVMEAFYSQTPLIILSADRPAELRDCGANQTCDQVKFFGDLVRWSVDLPCSDPVLPAHFVSTTIAQAVYQSMRAPKGPVQINCMFREPFDLTIPESLSVAKTEYTASLSTVPEEKLEELAAHLSSIEKGVIIAGELSSPSSRAPIYALAKKLGWPVLAEILSNARGYEQTIPYYDLILKNHPELKPDAILHLGDRLVSKSLIQWASAPFYCLVADHPLRHDPSGVVTHRLECDPLTFCEKLAEKVSSQNDWARVWNGYAQEISKGLDLFFEDQTTLSEPGTMRELSDIVTTDWSVFIANSMPIRDANTHLFPKMPMTTLFGNRGLSGIDGNIATTAGIALGTQKPTLAILGDVTTLHDLNSFALVKNSPYPIAIIIFNNSGGGIFSFLPIAGKTQAFETHFATAHNLTFSAAATLFELPYFHPSTQEEWEAALAQKQSCIIEITTDRQENFLLHKEILCACGPALSSQAF